MGQRLSATTESIFRDVHDGTLSAAFEIDPQLRAILEGTLRPDPGRAKFLEKAVGLADGGLLLKHAWHELKK